MSDLTKQEQEHVRIAMRGLCLRLGTRTRTRTALRLRKTLVGQILNGGGEVTASVAFRVARVLEASIDDLLAGRYHPTGACPYCGRGEDT